MQDKITQNLLNQYKTSGPLSSGAISDAFMSANPSATSAAKSAYTSSVAEKPTSVAPGSSDYLKSYRDYLSQYASSLSPSPEISSARTDLTNIRNLQDQTALDSRKAYEELINRSGMLKGGAEQAGSVSNRNMSYILANLGVAESGAARKLDALTGDQSARSNYLKALADMSKPMQIGNQMIDPTTGQIVYEEPQVTKDRPGMIGEYEYAVSQGYKGSFTDYQNEDANRRKSTAAPAKQTEAERKTNAYSALNSFLQPGAMVGTTPVLSPEGYLTYEAFKRLVAAAREDNISRKEFLAEYAPYINTMTGVIEGYGLTAAELKDLRGY